MTALEELISYLDIVNPAGAILVTGPWGSGKTYLIENTLKKEVAKKFIIIKVSLFGIDSIDAINAEVKKRWVEAFLRQREFDKIAEAAKDVADIAKKFPIAPAIKDILNINPFDYLEMKTTIDDKTVVLVFDDLERCSLSIVDILGCINSYCENRGFKTIIIANEERIRNKTANNTAGKTSNQEDKQLLYKEIKEKIIQRTVYYKPDYAAIISNMIDEYPDNNPDYRNFLLANKERISDLFVSGEKVFLNNIRSLKYAIQDFSRIFQLLTDFEIMHVERWIGPFFICLAFTKNDIGTDEDISMEQYLENHGIQYDENYFIPGVEEWITKGIWDSGKILSAAKRIKEKQNLDNDCNKLRLGSIQDLEDSAIDNGIEPLLEKAYSGEISLDDYLNLMQNFALARALHYSFSMDISGEKLLEGVNKCIERIKNGEVTDECQIQCDSPLLMKHYLEEQYESDIVGIIDSFRKSNYQYELQSQQAYMEALQKGLQSFKESNIKIPLISMTKEICDLIYEKYAESSNAVKSGFANDFRFQIKDMSKSSTNVRNLNYLKTKLKNLCNEYENKNQQMAAIHTRILLSAVDSKLEQ